MLRFFDWFHTLAFAVTFRESTWMFAVFDSAHLVALAIFAGAVLLVDFRLIGGGLTERPVSQVYRDAQPWLVGSAVALLVTGVPMIMANGNLYYYSEYFWQKMAVLPLAFLYTFTIRRRVALANEARVPPVWRRAAGFTSLGLWLFVAVWGRLIGLL